MVKVTSRAPDPSFRISVPSLVISWWRRNRVLRTPTSPSFLLYSPFLPPRVLPVIVLVPPPRSAVARNSNVLLFLARPRADVAGRDVGDRQRFRLEATTRFPRADLENSRYRCRQRYHVANVRAVLLCLAAPKSLLSRCPPTIDFTNGNPGRRLLAPPLVRTSRLPVRITPHVAPFATWWIILWKSY